MLSDYKLAKLKSPHYKPENLSENSKTLIYDFDVKKIKWQHDFYKELKKFTPNTLTEFLLSGAVGSAKTSLGVFLGIRHCINNPNARFFYARQNYPDLKKTVKKDVENHLTFMTDYIEIREQDRMIKFKNGAEMYFLSFGDGKTSKIRSYAFSSGIFEEATENESEQCKDTYTALLSRTGRVQGVPECFLGVITNPDSPSHWLYEYFMEGGRKVFYSKTRDNPFLPKMYIDALESNLDPLLKRRMLEGEWLDVYGERIYYAFSEENVLREGYKPSQLLPIVLTFDFNIAEGKPSSVAVCQRVDGVYYFFDELVKQGYRTADIIDELVTRDYLINAKKIIICGDSAGKHRDTRSTRSDYDIILKTLENTFPQTEIDYEVAMSNPAIRYRHNLVNSLLSNSKNEKRIFFNESCKISIKGMKETKLKKNSDVEDDTSMSQHITTAIGYAVNRLEKRGEQEDESKRILKNSPYR